MEMIHLYNGCYRDKKVIITGNTGFKGAWLTTWLLHMGADVYGISNGIPTKPSLFETAGLNKRIQYVEEDIRNAGQLRSVFSRIEPDFVFHLAAQPLVITSYHDPVDTMNTNVMGTVHVLEALRGLRNSCSAVIITSDKCYDNVEWLWGYRETDAVGGKDPYSASKGAAELMIKTYYHSYFAKPDSHIRVVSVRAGNVIGGGDWAENRIVPDCMRAWSEQKTVEIRSPYATRPWQHVLEPLSGYLLAGKLLQENEKLNGHAFNFGPNAEQNKTVLELIEALSKYWDVSADKLYNINAPLNFHEAGLLKLNCDKALHMLQWKPVLLFEETAKFTSLWYKTFARQKDGMFDFTTAQINEYIDIASQRNLVWCRN